MLCKYCLCLYQYVLKGCGEVIPSPLTKWGWRVWLSCVHPRQSPNVPGKSFLFLAPALQQWQKSLEKRIWRRPISKGCAFCLVPLLKRRVLYTRQLFGASISRTALCDPRLSCAFPSPCLTPLFSFAQKYSKWQKVKQGGKILLPSGNGGERERERWSVHTPLYLYLQTRSNELR